MKFNLYFRKSSFKKDKSNALLLLNEIKKSRPKKFIEVGLLEGVTSRNVCELLYEIHKDDFNFIGIDIFSSDENINNKEFTPISSKISNPFKKFYFDYIFRHKPNSLKGINIFLKKFSKQVKLFKGYSHDVLKEIELNDIDFVFLDGGHSYETVKNDLDILTSSLKKKAIIICDDYNMEHYGVKKSVDEIKNNFLVDIIGNRFAKITI